MSNKRKKNLLFIYPAMMIGGSTTALLSLLNKLDPQKYNIDLQLFRNQGPLIDMIPTHVTLLPPAEMHTGRKGKIIKIVKLFFSGSLFKAFFAGLTSKKKSILSRSVLTSFQAKRLSRKNSKHYDCAIGYLEGWSNRYLAFCTHADKKFAWLHSTFRNITTEPKQELPWMKKVDRIVFVTDACTQDFQKSMPSMAAKAITIENITDCDIVRQRSRIIDAEDNEFKVFSTYQGLRIITVCRLTLNVKGLDRIVNCAKKMKEANKPFLWYIIGDGDDKQTISELIHQHEIENCLILIGKRLNPYPFIVAADIMCMPSRYEGKPVTVTESMILGTPPIVTKYLSANEQIQNGVNGIVVENTDQAIFAPMLNILQNPSSIKKFCENLEKMEYENTEIIQATETALFGEQGAP